MEPDIENTSYVSTNFFSFMQLLKDHTLIYYAYQDTLLLESNFELWSLTVHCNQCIKNVLAV